MIKYVKTASGSNLCVDAKEQTDLPALVLSNSIGADFHMWDEFVSLMQNKVRIIRYDTRGHGRSDIGSEPFTMEMLARDVISILDNLEVSRAFICGLSLGGLTAQWLGITYPERFSGMILANTAANFPPATMWHDRANTVREQGLRPMVGATIDRWFTKSFQQANPARIAEISKMIEGTSSEGYARCCEVLAGTDLVEKIGNIGLPVQVICGQHDQSTTPARGQELVDRIPRASMVILNAAHISSIEASRAFAEAIEKFIGEAH